MVEDKKALPDGWIDTKLREVTFPRSEKVDPRNAENKAYLSLEHIESNTNRIIDIGSIEDVRSTKAVFFSGDVLCGKLRPYLNKVCQPEFDGVCSTDILVFGPTPAVDNRFLLRILSRRETVDYATRHSKGINLPRVNLQQLGELRVDLPPLSEQGRIVAKIEELQTRSRTAREALETIPELLEQLRQSILAAAFRGDLTKKWRDDHPDVEPASELLKRIRAERRKRWEDSELEKLKARGLTGEVLDSEFAKRRKQYKEPEPVDTRDLPELPQNWCWASLADLALIKTGLMKGKKRKEGVKLRKVPYLRVANVQRGHLDLKEVFEIEATEYEITELKLLYDDILLNEGGDLDKLGRGWVWYSDIKECIHQNHVFRARVINSKDLIPELISTYINEFGQEYFLDKGKQTTNLASVSLVNLSKTPVPVIPAKEAAEIWDKINSQVGIMKEVENALSVTQDKLRDLSQSILSKAFRGELVPQDPTDEPASVLLERIRREKERLATQEKPSVRRRIGKMKGTKERHILGVLLEAEGAMTPEELFAACGFEEESVDLFYEQLREAVAANMVLERRDGDAVRLEAVK